MEPNFFACLHLMSHSFLHVVYLVSGIVSNLSQFILLLLHQFLKLILLLVLIVDLFFFIVVNQLVYLISHKLVYSCTTSLSTHHGLLGLHLRYHILVSWSHHGLIERTADIRSPGLVENILRLRLLSCNLLLLLLHYHGFLLLLHLVLLLNLILDSSLFFLS